MPRENKSIRFITNAYSQNRDYNADCDYAIVTLDLDSCLDLLLVREQTDEFRQFPGGDGRKPSLLRATFSDPRATALFYSGLHVGELEIASPGGGAVTIEEVAEDGNFVTLPGDFDVSDIEPERIEFHTIDFDKSGVAFSGIPKHADFKVFTETLAFRELWEHVEWHIRRDIEKYGEPRCLRCGKGKPSDFSRSETAVALYTGFEWITESDDKWISPPCLIQSGGCGYESESGAEAFHCETCSGDFLLPGVDIEYQ